METPTNSNRHALPPGEKVGKFTIQNVLGQGGFGITYLAYDQQLHREVALKELFPVDLVVRSEKTIFPRDASLEKDFQRARSRFIKEGIALARFNHPAVAQVHEIIEGNGTAYIVTKLEEGRTLETYLRDLNKRPDRGEIISLLLPLLDGLKAVHSSGYLHRDIKPSNIMIGYDGQPVLIDFGSARSSIQNRAVMTAVVTPGYAPFEQYSESGDQGPWSDLFSLAGVMVRAIRGETPPDVMGRIVQRSDSDPYVPLHSDPALVEEYGAPLLRSIDKAMSVETDSRPQSAAEWRAMIVADSQETGSAKKSLASQLGILFRKLLPTSAKREREPVVRGVLPDSQFFPKTEDSHATKLGDDKTVSWSRPENGEIVEDSQKTRIIRRSPSHPSDSVSPTEEIDGDERTILQPRPNQSRLLRDEFEASPDLDQTRILGGGGAPGEDYGSPDSSALIITKCPSPERLGQRVVLDRYPFTVGRVRDSDLSIPSDDGMSRTHAVFDSRDDRIYISDAASANGVYVNGVQLPSNTPRQLAYGDEIRLTANTTLTFTRNIPSVFPELTGGVLDRRYILTRQTSLKSNSHWYEGHRETGPSGSQVQRVAIKLLSPDTSNQPHYLDAIGREVSMVSGLQNPNICPIMDFGCSATIFDPANDRLQLSNFAYIAYAFMGGGDLSDRMNRPVPMPLDVILGWHKTICDALSFVHENGILHAGLKPASIVFDDKGNPYLTDFAFAATQTDKSDFVMGAPAFLAPEQWKGEKTSPATDQYSMAAIAYLMITHRRPFEGQEIPEVRKRNFEMGPEPIAKCAARADVKIPRALNAVFTRALCENPDDRFPTIKDYHRELVRAASGKRADSRVSVFMSYRRGQNSSGWATFFQRELEREHGFRVFLDTQKQDAAMMVTDKIAYEIENCDIFVCLLSSETFASDWVLKEIEMAYNNNKPMISVRQESFGESSISLDYPEHVKALLSYDGIRLLDLQNEYVTEAVTKLAHRIKITVDE
ncbi:protein kinase [Luteolibacter arcticus]|uniref:non-specific serine/threonine protein kinase n=1 Tax=Luteolibacter arcticus TaxID=1581411 RepID=A0ABT3GQ71_9BACT|nr:protein kinase [Luteolibacter arcticus]MCW1925678.1 protein kinase [Luteolibacter arcticus]